MNRKFRTVLIVFLSLFLVLSAVTVIVVKRPYRESRKAYDDTAESFTARSETENGGEKAENGGQEETEALVTAPIRVDFEALKKVNEDVVGWIWCDDTVINYPVLQGKDNEKYLTTLFNGEYSQAGSIFEDAGNLRGFQDNNSILYGHHMADGSMFATLSEWQKQEYFDAHPVMWLLTPERDYRVELFSAYTISAHDETYTIFRGTGPELESYLKWMKFRSLVDSDVQPDPEGRYVLLSTCAPLTFEDARYVLHGMLVPVDSAGGLPLPSRASEG